MTTVGQQIWRLIEAPQGHSFISDDIENVPDERAFEIARIALSHMEQGARKLRRFLSDHGQLQSQIRSAENDLR